MTDMSAKGVSVASHVPKRRAPMGMSAAMDFARPLKRGAGGMSAAGGTMGGMQAENIGGDASPMMEPAEAGRRCLDGDGGYAGSGWQRDAAQRGTHDRAASVPRRCWWRTGAECQSGWCHGGGASYLNGDRGRRGGGLIAL